MTSVRLKYVDGIKVEHYPFKQLSNVGDELIIENGYNQLIRQSAYAYGHKHGWGFFTKCLGNSTDGRGMQRTYIRRIK